MEADTRKLLAEQEKERNKAIANTQVEHDKMIADEVADRKSRELNFKQLTKKYHREREAKRQRDLEVGVLTPKELAIRDELYLDALKDGKSSATHIWSASPQKRIGRKYVL